MPKYESWDERYNYTKAIASKDPSLLTTDDRYWLSEQETKLKCEDAFYAIKQGSTGQGSAGDAIMQKYGWLGRYTGWGVPKVDKGNW